MRGPLSKTEPLQKSCHKATGVVHRDLHGFGFDGMRALPVWQRIFVPAGNTNGPCPNGAQRHVSA